MNAALYTVNSDLIYFSTFMALKFTTGRYFMCKMGYLFNEYKHVVEPGMRTRTRGENVKSAVILEIFYEAQILYPP